MSHRTDLLLVLQAAKTIPQLGSFLNRLLTNRVIASVFLLHREELFQRQYFREQGVTIPLGTSGLPLMSHRAVPRCSRVKPKGYMSRSRSHT
jgi:hypothetical protein